MAKDLLAAIEHHESLSERWGALQDQRQKAFDYYLGRPFGNEVEGRSQVVSRDVADTIEWIKPNLLKVFAAGDELVRFDPHGPEDVQAAQQESDYINYLVTQKNNGYLIFYNWISDGLLSKTGYVKAWWEVKERIETENYQGLNDDEFALMLEDKSIEVVEHTEYMDEEYGLRLHDMKVRKKAEYGCVKIANLPPEQTVVSQNANSICLQDADFFEHWEWKTISDLRLEGFDVEDDVGYSEGETIEEEMRDRDYQPWRNEHDAPDPASRRVKVRECWIRFDEDGDGRAELRHVIVVGETILENEETDIIPVAAWSPTMVPHRHYGISVAEQVEDLQVIKSSLLRGALDNLYLSNNGRYAINADIVNLDDMLTSRPGGIVRVDGDPVQAILPLQHTSTGQVALPMMEYLDTVRENRTGVTRYNQGIDANSLNKTASGITQIMSAAQQRIELIARNLAETGVKDLFMIVHSIVLKHQTNEDIVKLRGGWVPVNPRAWTERKDMTVMVGLGIGNKEQSLVHLNAIFQAQMQTLPLGIANPGSIYKTLMRMANNAGFKDASEFYVDPSTQPPQPPQPNPEMMKLQAEQQQAQMQMQMDQQKQQADMAMKQQDAQAKMQIEQAKLEIEREKAMLQAQTEIEIAKIRIAADAQIEQMKAQLEANEQMRETLSQHEIGLRQVVEQARAAQSSDQVGAIMQGLQSVIQNISKQGGQTGTTL